MITTELRDKLVDCLNRYGFEIESCLERADEEARELYEADGDLQSECIKALAATLPIPPVDVTSDLPHTPEPWYVETGSIYGWSDGNPAALLKASRQEPLTSPTERDANVERAAACVNFCAGSSGEMLRELGSLQTVLQQVHDLRQLSDFQFSLVNKEEVIAILNSVFEDAYMEMDDYGNRGAETHLNRIRSVLTALGVNVAAREREIRENNNLDEDDSKLAEAHRRLDDAEALTLEREIRLSAAQPALGDKVHAPRTFRSATTIVIEAGTEGTIVELAEGFERPISVEFTPDDGRRLTVWVKPYEIVIDEPAPRDPGRPGA